MLNGALSWSNFSGGLIFTWLVRRLAAGCCVGTSTAYTVWLCLKLSCIGTQE